MRSPFAPTAKPKKPPMVSQPVWDEVTAMQKADRRRKAPIGWASGDEARFVNVFVREADVGWTFISSWDTTEPTKPSRSVTGSPSVRACTCTSR